MLAWKTWRCFQHPKPTPAARSRPCCGIIPNGIEAKPVNPLPKPPGWRMDTCRATSPQPWAAMGSHGLRQFWNWGWQIDENHGIFMGHLTGKIWKYGISAIFQVGQWIDTKALNCRKH